MDELVTEIKRRKEQVRHPFMYKRGVPAIGPN